MFPLVKDDLQSAKVLVTLKDARLPKAESVMAVLAVCQRRLEAEMLLVKNATHLSMEDDSEVLEGTQVRGLIGGIGECWLGARCAGPARPPSVGLGSAHGGASPQRVAWSK